MTLKQVNELPSPTWNHLEINGIDLSVPFVCLSVDPEGAEARSEDVAGIACGMGRDATAWLEAAAGQICSVQVPAGEKAADPVVVDLAQVAERAFALDVNVGEDAGVQVVLVGDPADLAGQTRGWSVRVNAGARSHVDVFSVVASAGAQNMDNVGIVCAEGATATVRQYVLDGDVSAVGLRCDLVGNDSSIDLDCKYLGRGEQTLDLGYVVRQLGRRTAADLVFTGVLSGNACKSLRDTIDLAGGCKGSRGSENESVILAGDGVGNQSLPVILCDEDDVAGDHGATVGEIAPEQLAYLVSRGIAPEDVPALVMESTFAAAYSAAPVECARAAVRTVAERVLGAETVADMLAEGKEA